MKFDNQLRHALRIIDTYQGEIPLHGWLKDFFRVNKQMGARDRRLLSTLVYGYYRIGHAVRHLPKEEKVLTALFLCNDQPNELLQYFKPDYNDKAALSTEEKIAFFQTTPAGAGFLVTDIFPWKDELSRGIDHEAFCRSFLRQPNLFLRIRPGHEKEVLEKLQRTVPSSDFMPPFTVRLPNGFKVEDLFVPDREVVVQDYSSQQIADWLRPVPAPSKQSTSAQPPPDHAHSAQPPSTPRSFWDACAASGGKSLLAHDLYPAMEITVSDIREPILQNLRQRFTRAGIAKYRSFVVDLSLAPFDNTPLTYDLVLADVPCTGSGTWSRTPEQLFFFDPKKIDHYSALQKKIISHIAPRLAKGANIVYSTCSVFRRENEEIAALLQDEFGLRNEKQGNIKGYNRQADSMFAARFRA